MPGRQTLIKQFKTAHIKQLEAQIIALQSEVARLRKLEDDPDSVIGQLRKRLDETATQANRTLAIAYAAISKLGGSIEISSTEAQALAGKRLDLQHRNVGEGESRKAVISIVTGADAATAETAVADVRTE